jgi:hypothetical protein
VLVLLICQGRGPDLGAICVCLPGVPCRAHPVCRAVNAGLSLVRLICEVRAHWGSMPWHVFVWVML